MRRKLFLTAVLSAILSLCSFASDEGTIALGVYVSNDDTTIPAEAASLLESKLQKIIAENGLVDNELSGRFALVAKCDVLQKDVTPTTPPRISQKIEVTFLVVDLLENKIYGSSELTVSGIGVNENKSYSSAFQKISVQKRQIQSLLTESKQKILDFYSNSCPQIETEANTLASMGQYDKAIFSLMSVPPVSTECYNSCRELASKIYQQKIDSESRTLLEKSKSIWASSPSPESASMIADIICDIDPRSSNYKEVVDFRNTISRKLAEDARKEWELKIKKYDDNKKFKQSIISACQAVGVAFAQNFRLPDVNLFKRY